MPLLNIFHLLQFSGQGNGGNFYMCLVLSEGLALSLASSLSQHRLWLVVCYLQLDCLLVGSSIYTVSVGAYSQYITTYLTTHHLRCYCAQIAPESPGLGYARSAYHGIALLLP